MQREQMEVKENPCISWFYQAWCGLVITAILYCVLWHTSQPVQSKKGPSLSTLPPQAWAVLKHPSVMWGSANSHVLDLHSPSGLCKLARSVVNMSSRCYAMSCKHALSGQPWSSTPCCLPLANNCLYHRFTSELAVAQSPSSSVERSEVRSNVTCINNKVAHIGNIWQPRVPRPPQLRRGVNLSCSSWASCPLTILTSIGRWANCQ